MSSVELEGINKSYGSFWALRDVDLTVAAGEFLTLLGASGSGKTTLLNVISGMIACDTGAVTIDGRDVTSVPPRRRGLGMVFQSYALVPHMSVFDNIAFPLKIRSMRSAEIKKRVDDILEVVQLGHVANRKPRELSGGQQQRVAIARCLVYEPPVILMDEPLGALDKKLREQLQQEIRRIHREMKVTIIYVTHDQEEALYLSDRICLMRDGQIEQIGPPHSLYFEPNNAFVADFVGESNLLPCEMISSETVRLLQSQKSVRIGSPVKAGTDQPVSLLLRPDRIKVLTSGENAINELSGTVMEVAFVGEATRFLVESGSDVLRVKVSTDDGLRDLSIGSEIRLGWEPRDGYLLEASGN